VTDLVARLRMLVEGEAPDKSGREYLIEVLQDAAAEIERLQLRPLSLEVGRLQTENERLRAVAKLIIESAQSTGASANSVLVHRQLIGELREALRGAEEKT
jgi:hypothetical protein